MCYGCLDLAGDIAASQHVAGTYYHRSVNPISERPGHAYPHSYFYQADDPHDVDWETRAYGDHVYQTDIDDSLMEPDSNPRRTQGAPWFRTDPANVGEMTHIHDPTAPFGIPRRTANLEFHPIPGHDTAYKAWLDDKPVGRIMWSHDAPPEGVPPFTVQHIEVHPDHLRQGIATALFNHVKQYVEPNLQHSDLLSEDGAAFARSMGHSAKMNLPYMRNNGGMRHVPGFDQDYEPWGRYMSHDDADTHPPLQKGWERGNVSFDNPLMIPHDYGAWKQQLSEAHGGLTGQALSNALLAKGHDGIITHDKYGIGEIVDIRPKDQRGHQMAMFNFQH